MSASGELEVQGRDPYTVLEVSRSATQAEIKAAYRRLVKQHHPDMGGSADEFRRVSEAYQQLIS